MYKPLTCTLKLRLSTSDLDDSNDAYEKGRIIEYVLKKHTAKYK